MCMRALCCSAGLYCRWNIEGQEKVSLKVSQTYRVKLLPVYVSRCGAVASTVYYRSISSSHSSPQWQKVEWERSKWSSCSGLLIHPIIVPIPLLQDHFNRERRVDSSSSHLQSEEFDYKLDLVDDLNAYYTLILTTQHSGGRKCRTRLQPTWEVFARLADVFNDVCNSVRAETCLQWPATICTKAGEIRLCVET